MKLRAGAVAREVNFSQSELVELSLDLIRDAAECWQLRFSSVNKVRSAHVNAEILTAESAAVRLVTR